MALERFLKILMAVFCAKQYANVTRRDRARLTRRRIPHERLGIEEAANLDSHSLRVLGDARSDDDAERIIGRHWELDRKRVLLAETKRVAPLFIFFDFREHVVRKRQQPRHRAETLRNRPTRVMVRAQPVNKRPGFVHHRDIGVAKPINRLLAIADEKNRRRQRTLRDAAAFGPRPDEQRHQRPLGAARVLELVEQHVVITSLEPVAASRELVHLRQQRQCLRKRL
jgi:hypothetical protein